MDTHKSALT